MSALITDFVAVCHNEPRGDFGLEGYQRGESYRCQHVKDAACGVSPAAMGSAAHYEERKK